MKNSSHTHMGAGVPEAPANEAPAFSGERLGIIMEPTPGDVEESLGVLNPGVARGPDGGLHLFPRLVGPNNYSRIGHARAGFDARGTPASVERLGIALQPEELYECNPWTGGGCEDPRVTFIDALNRYVMAYTAFGPTGPRIAVAISEDLVTWRRLGGLHFARARVDFSGYGNKDASFFPEPVLDPDGHVALAVIHRPTYRQHFADGSEQVVLPAHIADARESIWISYVNLARAQEDIRWLTHVHENHLLMAPHFGWEQVKLGGGPPPTPIAEGWMLLYHGIRPIYLPDGTQAARGQYCAGVAVLDRQRPWHILYRSPEPVLVPLASEEQVGTVPNVVFPTGMDPRPELGERVFDVYYGMADTRIGVARLRVPEHLPLRLHNHHAHLPHAQPAAADAHHPNPPKLVPPRTSHPNVPGPVSTT